LTPTGLAVLSHFNTMRPLPPATASWPRLVILTNKNWKPEPSRTQEPVEEVYRPVKTFIEHKNYTTAIDINPSYITHYRTDYNFIDDANWKCFTNSRYNRDTKKWELKKVPYVQLIKD
jgi:hypothetical protein